MYRKSNRAQMKLEGFFLPFGGHLSSENRWVRMAKLMPWELIKDLYPAKQTHYHLLSNVLGCSET